jgi:hypothetical protein
MLQGEECTLSDQQIDRWVYYKETTTTTRFQVHPGIFHLWSHALISAFHPVVPGQCMVTTCPFEHWINMVQSVGWGWYIPEVCWHTLLLPDICVDSTKDCIC